MYFLKKEDISRLTTAVAEGYALFGPRRDELSGEVVFDRLTDPGLVDLEAPIPYNPPKHIVFPHNEELMSYRRDEASGRVKITRTDLVEPKALFGLRPCDLTGLLCLDRFFMGQEYVDEFYLEHRKRLFIVSNTCVHPFPQCFCVCTDSGPYAAEGYDLNLTFVGDGWLVESGSKKGLAMVERLGLEEAGPDAEAGKREVIDRSLAGFDEQAMENKAWISRAMNRLTTGFIPNEVWEYIGDQCFECGACSFVCPTCSCFNIEDVNMPEGERIPIG